MEAEADPTANPNPIDEERRLPSAGRQLAADEFVAVDKIAAIDLGIGDLDDGQRVVGLPGLIDGQRGIWRIAAEVVLASLRGPFLEITGRLNVASDPFRPVGKIKRLGPPTCAG